MTACARRTRSQSTSLGLRLALAVLLAATGSAGAVTVRFGTPLAAWPEMETAKSRFEQTHPGIEIELVQINGDLGEGLLRLAA
ncbi:MAG TPA: hypothetical protein VF234_06255, partial [Limnochordia bacterium]